MMTVPLTIVTALQAVKGVTVLDGIQKKLGDRVKVNYAKGCEITTPELAGDGSTARTADDRKKKSRLVKLSRLLRRLMSR